MRRNADGHNANASYCTEETLEVCSVAKSVAIEEMARP